MPEASISELQQLRDRVEELEELLGLRTKLNAPFPLGPTERRLLGILLAHAGRVLSREFILRAGWGLDIMPRIVDTYVMRLRRHQIDIRTELGVGYYLPLQEKERLKQWFVGS